jgi:hypothetical protein
VDTLLDVQLVLEAQRTGEDSLAQKLLEGIRSRIPKV